MTATNTPANGGQIPDWKTRTKQKYGAALMAGMNEESIETLGISFMKAEIADLRASLAAPAIPTVDRNAVLLEAIRAIEQNYTGLGGPIDDPHPNAIIHNGAVNDCARDVLELRFASPVAQPAAQVAVSKCSYRKKPVVIEAVEYTGGGNFANPYLPEWIWKALESGAAFNRHGELIIKTLEGEHLASPGDWIIRGVKGEIYPCKPEIFALTYERTTLATVKTAEGQ